MLAVATEGRQSSGSPTLHARPSCAALKTWTRRRNLDYASDLSTPPAKPLQDENEEMGRELAEGRVHELERGAALAKGFADDLRRAYASLEDHTHTLDRENEDLQVQDSPCVHAPAANRVVQFRLCTLQDAL